MSAKEKFARFSGGPMVASAAIGVLGLALTGARAFMGDPSVALFSYVVGFAYWLGLALAAVSIHEVNAINNESLLKVKP